MSIARFRAAYVAAYNAFQHTWDNFDAFEAKAVEVATELKRRNAKLTSALSKLTASDGHFVESFLHNLVPDERPRFEPTQRFVSILNNLEPEAAIEVAKRALSKCPKLISAPGFATWAAKNASFMGKPLSRRTVTPEVTP